MYVSSQVGYAEVETDSTSGIRHLPYRPIDRKWFRSIAHNEKCYNVKQYNQSFILSVKLALLLQYHLQYSAGTVAADSDR